MRKQMVSIIGGHKCTKEVEQLAQNIGKKLAKVVDYLVCGGLGGVMEAAAKGFHSENGTTIGIITSYNRNDANQYIDIVIPSGMGLARNILVVKSADVVVALPGEAGTLSELAYCLQFGIPVVSLGSWDLPGITRVSTVEEAVEAVKGHLKGIKT